MSSFTPSVFQRAIFDFISNPDKGSAIVRAVAGSGKTTTIIHSLRLLSPSARVALVAFNKSIAEELTARAPKTVQVGTMHSFAFRAFGRTHKAKVDGQKVSSILRMSLSDKEFALYGADARRLIGFGKSAGIGAIAPNDPAEWGRVMEAQGFELSSEEESEERLIDIARKTLITNNDQASIVDFDDMLTFPIVHRVRMPEFDWLFVDEAQDLSPVQHALIRMMLGKGGRLIAVGDPRQAIYAFRGAASDSLVRLAETFGAIELPLSVSYRCARAIVKEAQTIAPEIEPGESATEGEVRRGGKWRPSAGEAIVCRNVRPLVGVAYRLIAARVRCAILGRDIGDSLVAILNRFSKSSPSIEAAMRRVDEWAEAEMARMKAKGMDGAVSALEDKVDALNMITSRLDPNATVSEAVAEIRSLFAERPDAQSVVLSTVHKSKGLEFPTVYVLDGDTLMPSKWARTEAAKEQERNLIYVAITRAASLLHFVRSEELALQ